MDRRKPITECRSCHSTDLQHIYSLGDQYISGFWDGDDKKLLGPNVVTDTDTWIVAREKWPLTLVYCNCCTLMQLSHNAPQEILYQHHYWYRSGTNYTMTRALEDVVKAGLNSYLYPGKVMSKHPVWLDIGANDGTLLSFVPHNWYRVGVEPADNLAPLASIHADYMIHDFWHGYGPEKADVITAIGMLYDLEDPNTFVADMKKALAPDGVIICQLMCLEQMLANNDVGNICHEHLEYYSLHNLDQLFERHGLAIHHVEGNEVNGGSYRMFINHADEIPAHYTRITPYVAEKFAPTLDDIYWFTREIEKQRDACVDFIETANDNNEEVWVYGASTKGNVILQYYGLSDDTITAAADRNPAKWGKVMAGSGIPIVSEADFREAAPDYALMLPYAFKSEFMQRERDWHKHGGHWLIPLPTFEVW